MFDRSRASICTIVAAVAFVVCLSGQAGAGFDVGKGPRDAVLFADLVVRGVVQKVSGQQVPVQEFVPGDPREDVLFPITVVSLIVNEVVRGLCDSETLEVVVPGNYPGRSGGLTDITYDYSVGDQLLLALVFYEPMRGGSYMLHHDKGRFNLGDGVWVNRADKSVRMSLSEVRSLAKLASPGHLYRVADIVGLGTVTDISGKPSGHVHVLSEREITIAPQMLLKGKGGDLITVYAELHGPDEVSPNRPVPLLQIGQEVVFFLKQIGDRFYPFGGSNGLLTVSGRDLILNNRVAHAMSKNELIASVSQGED